MSNEPKTPVRTLPRRLLRALLLYGLVPYLSVTIIFTVLQRRLMYRPTVSASLSINEMRLDPSTMEDVQIQVSDDVTLHGWHLKPTKPEPDGFEMLVIYFPGNAQNRFLRLVDLKEIVSCGYHVLIFDYRGYGDSSGHPSEAVITADARRICTFAREQLGFDEDQIVLFGESLGGAVALSLWADNDGDSPQPRAVILSSTFASMTRTVACSYPWFPFQYLLLDRWPSVDRISRVAVPVTIYHGTEDELVPISEAKALAVAGGPHVTFVEIPNGEHNDIPMHLLRTELKRISTDVISEEF